MAMMRPLPSSSRAAYWLQLAGRRTQVDDGHARPQQAIRLLDLLELEDGPRTPAFFAGPFHVRVGLVLGEPGGGRLGALGHGEADSG